MIPLGGMTVYYKSLALYRAGVRNMQDIIDLGRGKVMRLRCVGKKSFYEIEEKMKEYGAEWKN